MVYFFSSLLDILFDLGLSLLWSHYHNTLVSTDLVLFPLSANMSSLFFSLSLSLVLSFSFFLSFLFCRTQSLRCKPWACSLYCLQFEGRPDDPQQPPLEQVQPLVLDWSSPLRRTLLLCFARLNDIHRSWTAIIIIDYLDMMKYK